MLVRDYMNANARGTARLMRELLDGEREIALFLLDHHPTMTPYITSSHIIGVGWEHSVSEDDSIRWLGEGYSPAGVNSSLISTDHDIAMVMLSNRLARDALTMEKRTKMPVWVFAQAHIKTLADAAKLSRYMQQVPLPAIA